MEFNLDTPLLELHAKNGVSFWTARDAVEGVQIFGGIGSGKTTGSGRTLALKYLKAGFGGLVLTVKPDEKKMWEEYCHQAGRSHDLLIVGPDHPNYFNFLDYESSQANGNSLTENIVEVLKTVIRASDEKANGNSDDPFWETALDMLIFNMIDFCKLAYEKVSLENIYKIVQNIPKADTSRNENNDSTPFYLTYDQALRNVQNTLKEWELTLPTERLLQLTDKTKYDEAGIADNPDVRLFRYVDEFLNSFSGLHEKTRSIVEFSFSGFLYRMLRDPIYSLFCSRPFTFTPEDCCQGKIILLDIPVKLYHKIGRDCQIMFKYIWQRAMEKRPITETTKPVFLWADEAQHFLHEHDADFQATARSSRVATVYLSQNLPNYHANMGGAKSEFRVKSFLGTLATKIFHANADIETNKYASELIGEAYREDTSRSTSMSKEFSIGQSVHYKLEKMVRPEEFMRLKTGGPRNNKKVEAYLHHQGNPVDGKLNFIKTQFTQH